MKLQTIGYVLDNIEVDGFAYCYKGACKGVLLFSDQSDENRLKLLYPDGYITDKHFFKKDPSITYEDSKEWLLFKEVDSEDIKKAIYEQAANSVKESLKLGYEITIN